MTYEAGLRYNTEKGLVVGPMEKIHGTIALASGIFVWKNDGWPLYESGLTAKHYGRLTTAATKEVP